MSLMQESRQTENTQRERKPLLEKMAIATRCTLKAEMCALNVFIFLLLMWIDE